MLYETILDRNAFILLKECCELTFLRNFSLSGGTALALRLGHRISYDLDLFSKEKFVVNDLHQELESHFGLEYVKRGSLSNALFSTIRNIKVDFVFDYGKKLEDVERFENIRLFPLSENIAMKLNAISGRGKKRDFYDLYFILEVFSLPQILQNFSDKYGEERLMMLYKSFLYFDDAENDETPVLLKENINWAKVKKTILNKMKNIEL